MRKRLPAEGDGRQVVDVWRLPPKTPVPASVSWLSAIAAGNWWNSLPPPHSTTGLQVEGSDSGQHGGA